MNAPETALKHRRVWQPLLWCGLATLLVYWPALWGGIVYDDELILRQNAALRGGDFGALLGSPFFVAQIGYYRPVASVLMSIAWQLGDVAGVHGLALLAHACSGAVAFGFLRAVLGDRWRAALATLVFLWHPVQVESVAWASAVSGPIATLLSLLAMRAALGWRDHGAVPGHWPWRAALLWLLALLAKESAVAALPLLLGVVAWAPGRSRTVRWRPLLLALAGAFAVWVALRLAMLAAPLGMTTDATGPWRLVSAPAELFVRHLLLLLLPYPLTPFHGFAPDIGAGTALVWLAAGIAVLAVGALVLYRVRAAVRIGVLFAIAPLLPHVVHFQVAGHYPLAERYLYLATLGAGLLLAVTRWGRLRWLPWTLALGLGAASLAQVFVWRDQRSLVGHGVVCSPGDPLLHVMTGDLELQIAQDSTSGDSEALGRAMAAYERALEFASTATNAATRKARADASLGLAWCELFAEERRGQFDGERLLAMFRAALACDETVAAAWVGLGVAESIAHGPVPAESAFRRAIDLNERCAEAWYYLGRLQFDRDPVAARASLQRALACNPDLGAARELLARLR